MSHRKNILDISIMRMPRMPAPPPTTYLLKTCREVDYKELINKSTIQLIEINIFQSHNYKKDLD